MNMNATDLRLADILLVHGDGPISMGIEAVTRSPFSHVCIYAGDSQVIEADVFRNLGYAPVSKYHGKSLVMRVASLTDAQLKAIVNYAESLFGTHYDYAALLQEFDRYVLGHNIDASEHHRLICSSAVALEYKNGAGVQLVDAGIVVASPDDIYRSPVAQFVGRY